MAARGFEGSLAMEVACTTERHNVSVLERTCLHYHGQSPT